MELKYLRFDLFFKYYNILYFEYFVFFYIKFVLSRFLYILIFHKYVNICSL